MFSPFFKFNLSSQKKLKQVNSCVKVPTDPHKQKRGFTLIELMVTISIFVFMTAILLSNYNAFGSGTILTNMAYDIALTIRQAQTYGLSVKVGDGTFKQAYGVHFSTTLTGDDNKKFILFRDDNGNNIFVSGENIVMYNLKRGAYISKICMDDTCSSKEKVDILFKRPNPRAIICDGIGVCSYKSVAITISSADDSSKRIIEVTEAGQISVQDP